MLKQIEKPRLLKWSGFWLSLMLVALVSLPALALPKSMIMTMVISSKQGSKPVTANATLWYANQKFRAEVTSNMTATNSPVKIGNKATIVMDIKSKVGYLIDDSSKIAIKVDQTQLQSATGGKTGPKSFADPAQMTDPAKIKAEIQRQGGKVVGSANLLGHKCTIWQMSGKVPAQQGQPAQNVTAKVWLADDLGMPLKVEVRGDKMGEIMNMRATNVQVNVPVSNSKFGIPAGYKIRPLGDMYKTK